LLINDYAIAGGWFVAAWSDELLAEAMRSVSVDLSVAGVAWQEARRTHARSAAYAQVSSPN
jgi:hypothetical protein